MPQGRWSEPLTLTWRRLRALGLRDDQVEEALEPLVGYLASK